MLDPIPRGKNRYTRRQWLETAGAAAIGTTWASRLLAAEPAEDKQVEKPALPMQIGLLLGTISRPTFEARLDALKEAGLDVMQVSLGCLGGPDMPDEISAELSARICREAAKRGITVAAVQGTFNMSHPDAEQRRAGLRRLKVLAAACAAMGTAKVHLCSGTRDRDNMWRRHAENDTPEAWRDMLATMREAADIAKESKVVLAFEPEVNNVVDSAQKARRLLDEVRSPHLKVTIDAANIFHAGELPRMREILDKAFELLGKNIVLAHAKDLTRDGDAGHEAAGRGKLDYDRYLALLYSSGYRGPLLLHGLSESQIRPCAAFLREKLARIGPNSR
jgi:sugar phosphate isomerase/epimerase